MTELRVWAPAAGTVEVDIGGERLPLGPGRRRGWWMVDVPWATPGTDYRYVLDGGPPVPDPRSPWQPDGVFGPSRLYNHGAFPWTDDGWRGVHLPAAILYELHVGTFTPEGTFEGVIERLDHLVELGIDAVELLPVAEFPGDRGWGYDGVDLYAPHHAYGGPDGLKKLVDACHHRGIGVVIDVVYNHLGPAGNFLSQFGPYFTDRYSTPWGDAVNLDGPESDEVRSFFIDNALMWLRDYHCDGLRIDAVHAIFDRSATHFLEQLAAEVDGLSGQVGRPLFLIAESDLNDPRIVQRTEAGGYGLAAQWTDDFHHAIHAVLTGERSGYYRDFGAVGDISAALEQGFVYVGQYSKARGRRHGRHDPSLPGYRYVAFLQNHDQVGNRAQGDRLSTMAGLARAKVAAALLLTSAFVPMLFQGEEWGAATPFQYFTDHDETLGRAVREGRRREFESFGWSADEVPDPQAEATFERSRLDWAERDKEPHDELLRWYQDLISLRRTLGDLSDGRLPSVRVDYDEGGRWLVVRRGRIATLVNLGDEPTTFPMAGTVLFASSPKVSVRAGGVVVPPDDVAIVALADPAD